MTKQVTLHWPPSQRILAIATLIVCLTIYNIICLWALTLNDPGGGVFGLMCELLAGIGWASYTLFRTAQIREDQAVYTLCDLGYIWSYHDDRWESPESQETRRQARYEEYENSRVL